MVQVDYGFPVILPLSADFVVFSNEDIGFVASLATGVNDVFAFALPYPASTDLMLESMVVWAMEFVMQISGRAAANLGSLGLYAYLSMLDREFAATFVGVGADVEDENLKAQFARLIYFGDRQPNLVTTAATEPSTGSPIDNIEMAMYGPPAPLDLISPLYVQLTNASRTRTLITNAVAGLSFSGFEQVYIVVWFTMRTLSSFELSVRSMQLRYQRIDS